MPPNYYSSLGPFRETFNTGVPILTYHKLGPRPARVRLKGLYVSAGLFNRQLTELRQAGYASAAPSVAASAETPPGRHVVLTFDDGFENVPRHGLTPLAGHGFHAIQFLLSDRIGQMNDWEQAEGEAPERLMDEAQVREWLAAGHWIGSHTRTHPWLTRLSPEAAREEIVSSKRALEDRFDVAVEHFCYPYGDWNERVRDLVAEAGYATACTTDAGINRAGDDPHSLRRFTARYPTRSLKAIWRRLVSSRSGRYS